MASFDDANLLAELRLLLIPGIGPRIRKFLLERFGSAEAVFRADFLELMQVPGVGKNVVEGILDPPRDAVVQEQLGLCRHNGVRILTDSDPAYPRLLRSIYDPPGLIFVRGNLTPADHVSLAVIGTRHASNYGERQTHRLVAEFVHAGFSVVSGLARGIDGYAHRAALDVGGRTVAVLGHGLGLDIYPPENRGLARDILDQDGAIISEFPPLTSATRGTFPQRNRIIAGMTLGTVVVEAGQRSGTSLTAQFALDFGRAVFAVPGPIDSRVSMGCHQLIRDGARLLESVDDVLEELGPISRHYGEEPEAAPASGAVSDVSAAPRRASTGKKTASPAQVERPAELTLSAEERSVFEAVPSSGGATVDQLTEATGIPVFRIMTILTELEIKRLVKRGAGQRVFRC